MTPIPVESAELSIKEKRYIVIDKDSGKVLDDASGFGFKSKENAMRHYNGFQKDLDDIIARETKSVSFNTVNTQTTRFNERAVVEDGLAARCEYIREDRHLPLIDRYGQTKTHDFQTAVIYKFICEVDGANGDVFRFCSGHDKDNGEFLMDLLDLYFRQIKEAHCIYNKDGMPVAVCHPDGTYTGIEVAKEFDNE